MIVAVILFSIAVVIAVWCCITVDSTTESGMWLLFLIPSTLFIVGGIAAIDLTPTNKDVREGKAHYIEQNHIKIINGDTVNNYKTYHIEWIENFK